ncbi:hypothetical protein LTR22_020334 [Elasticomyces elasticus]|nr:hypothetical protein LTR22_020334 [Elasticomyces elasticus]
MSRSQVFQLLRHPLTLPPIAFSTTYTTSKRVPYKTTTYGTKLVPYQTSIVKTVTAYSTIVSTTSSVDTETKEIYTTETDKVTKTVVTSSGSVSKSACPTTSTYVTDVKTTKTVCNTKTAWGY